MQAFTNIQNKLSFFYKKYYTNELIKGLILFFSLGALYLFVTLFIEYFLWLKPVARTILFLVFILVEVYLLFRFILKPILKLIGLQKGISLEQSSKIIGNHFPEVQDKLLNILQLKETSNQSDLLLASIDQKAKEIQPIQFAKAVNFKKNIPYLKYLLIPALIWIISLVSGANNDLSNSFSRVVNYQAEYIPPAPFTFNLQTNSLQVIEGNSFIINVSTNGDVVPEEAKILYNNQEYFMQEKNKGVFFFTFTNVVEPIDFKFKSNKVESITHSLEVIKTPTIQNITVDLDYPNYTGKKDETIDNTGSILVPEGTNIKWLATTNQTDSVAFISNNKRDSFIKKDKNSFQYNLKAKKNIQYQISSSNKELQDFEKLSYNIKVVKDEFPSILIQSNIDSLERGDAQFAGQISDDYGISQLELFYYNQDAPQEKTKITLETTKEKTQTFFYQFPDQLKLQEGIDYEIYFQVSDNDAVNGRKKAISKKFRYRQKTEDEVAQELLQDQKNTIQNLEKSVQNQKQQKKELDEIQKEIQNKKDINWNDKKKVDEFIKRQKQYEQMMERQTENLQETLEEKKEENQTLQEKKQELQKRIEELKKLNKQKKLLDELQKMAKKLDKEELVKKAKQLAQENKQQERSLERILELTKRFYFEEKTLQIANKLKTLSKRQDTINNTKNDAVN